MTVRVGINGFGRMGRLFLRAALQETLSAAAGRGFEVVHINELNGGPETAAHLLKFDSVHGRLPMSVSSGAYFIQVEDRKFSYSQRENSLDVPWSQMNVDIIVECTGKFKARAILEPYCSGSVKKVIVAAPFKDADLNIVMGVNDNL